MTYEELIAMLESLGETATYHEEEDHEVYVTLQDKMRKYDEDAADDFVEMLEESAERVEGDFYQYYYFEGFSVEVGYASFDD